MNMLKVLMLYHITRLKYVVYKKKIAENAIEFTDIFHKQSKCTYKKML